MRISLFCYADYFSIKYDETKTNIRAALSQSLIMTVQRILAPIPAWDIAPTTIDSTSGLCAACGDILRPIALTRKCILNMILPTAQHDLFRQDF